MSGLTVRYIQVLITLLSALYPVNDTEEVSYCTMNENKKTKLTDIYFRKFIRLVAQTVYPGKNMSFGI